MQEVVQLVTGIDLCRDITQVSIMQKSTAEPEPLYFDAEKKQEFFPTSLYLDSEGNYHIGKKEGCLCYQSFLEDAFREESENSDNTKGRFGRELLHQFLYLLLEAAKETYDGDIGYVAITCEESSIESAEKVLIPLLVSLSLNRNQISCISHMDAFFHFAIRQEETLRRDGAAAFDYTFQGLLFYSMECKSAGGRRILIADRKDYTGSMKAKPELFKEPELLSERFREIAGGVMKQRLHPLFITGRSFEGEWVSDVLHFLSFSRRVFRGQNLYTQGACFTAAEIFRNEKNADFSILHPNQISVDIYLTAATVEGEGEIRIAHVGQNYEEVSTVVDLIFDGTDRLNFRVVPLGGTAVTMKMAPLDLVPRADHTSRYQLRVFFAKKDCVVLQLKEIGFGEFYPSTNRIYEELVDLSQMIL